MAPGSTALGTFGGSGAGRPGHPGLPGLPGCPGNPGMPLPPSSQSPHGSQSIGDSHMSPPPGLLTMIPLLPAILRILCRKLG